MYKHFAHELVTILYLPTDSVNISNKHNRALTFRLHSAFFDLEILETTTC